MEIRQLTTHIERILPTARSRKNILTRRRDSRYRKHPNNDIHSRNSSQDSIIMGLAAAKESIEHPRVELAWGRRVVRVEVNR